MPGLRAGYLVAPPALAAAVETARPAWSTSSVAQAAAIAAAADAVALRRRILAHGVLVRDCTSFGLRGWLRVAARPAADRARLLAALEQELR